MIVEDQEENYGEGFIKLFRSITKWEWYDEANTFRVFLHCLFLANHKDKKWRGINIKRGQFITSIGVLSKGLKLTPKKVRTAISNLERTNEMARSTTSKYTVITVTNYDFYQEKKMEGKVNGKQKANGGQTEGKPMATTKKYKNEEEAILPPSLLIAKEELGVATTDGKKIDNSEVEFALEVKSRYEQIRAEYVKGSRGLMWEGKNYCSLVQLKRNGITIDEIEAMIFNMFESDWHKESKWKSITPEFIGRKSKVNKYL